MRVRRETFRTGTPKNHFRLINLVARIGGGRQARGIANSAVDVDRLATRSTDQVVVIVTDTIFVEGRGSGRLDAPDEAPFGQHSEGVVDSLSGNGTDLGANVFSDVVGTAVGSCRDRP